MASYVAQPTVLSGNVAMPSALPPHAGAQATRIQAGQLSRSTYTAPARGSYPAPITVAIQSQQPRSVYSQGGTVASSVPFQQYGSFPRQQRGNPQQMMMTMNGAGTSGSKRAYSPPAPPLLSTMAATRSTATSTPSAAKTAGDKQVVLGGEIVKLINDADYFEPIRRMEGVTLSDVGSEAQFSFKNLGAGGGKGGSLMTFTTDGRFLIKQLSGDDHDSLCRCVGDYSKHLTTHPSSLLSRYYFHFQRQSDMMFYVAMDNCTAPNAKIDSLYDLKGSADDKFMVRDGSKVPQLHKRWFRLDWFIMEASCTGALPEGRRRYRKGKTDALNEVFRLERSDRDRVLKSVREDVAFLARNGLMDYSLLIAKVIGPANAPKGFFPPSTSGAKPAVVVGKESSSAYYMGIIDFLQGWSGGKKVAHVIKVLFAPRPISTIPPAEYAEQFLAANERRFQ